MRNSGMIIIMDLFGVFFAEFFVLPAFVLCIVPNIACISGLSIFDSPFGFL